MGIAGYVSVCVQNYCVGFHCLSLHVSAYMAIFRFAVRTKKKEQQRIILQAYENKYPTHLKMAM
jgi:hypothetical protein